MHPSKSLQRHLIDVVQNGRDIFQTDVICKDGTISFFEMNTCTIKLGEQIVILNVSRDIAKRLEDEKFQKRFILTASHELRTPISVIIQSLNNINNYKQKLTEENYSNLIKIMTQNAEFLHQITEDLLLLTKIDEKAISLKWEIYKPHFSIQNILEYIEPLRSVKGTQIHMNVDENIEILGDMSKMATIFRILIDNAIKYSDQNSILNITATDHYQGEFNPKSIDGLLIEFTDTGDGIKKEDIRLLFKRFSRLDTSSPGSGLGIALVRELLQLHGGKIYVQSEFKKGTTFSIFLPRYKHPPKK